MSRKKSLYRSWEEREESRKEGSGECSDEQSSARTPNGGHKI